ncbi:MAG: pitrilysin family protein [Lysobacterales bacterium]
MSFRPWRLLWLLLVPTWLAASELPELPYERFVLDNGLTVVVHTDRKAPIVAVNVWYHVGSKDEPAGRTGFAHLFEHLMFNGSKNHPGEFFDPFEQVGATDMNGTTSQDRTNYFQTVPTTALEMALWMESDRMGHLLPAIDQAKLDEQRGVVKNEKRQGDNQPYGALWERLLASSFPPGHPYHHDTIGSMEDLDAAAVEDVGLWFESWYGAANATLVLAGDVDVATARPLVEQYFGWIGSGPPRQRMQRQIAARQLSTREVIEDRVPQARWTRSWNVPPMGDHEAEALDVAAEVLGGGKTSRLYQRLVYRDQIADNVSVSNSSFELAGLFSISVDIKSGVDEAQIESAVMAELAQLLRDGPTEAELVRVRRGIESSFIRGVERIGGFGGKADVLAAGQVHLGDPGAVRASLQRTVEMSAQDVRDAAGRWLAQGDHTILISPFTARDEALDDAVDRSTGVPSVDSFPTVQFPAIEQARLSNGIPVYFARRDAVPVIQISAIFAGGSASDARLGLPLGTAGFAASMLDEGAGERDALQIATTLDELGASLAAGSGLDHASVGLSTLRESLQPALDLLADVIRRPRFDEGEIERLRSRWLASIAQERAQPTGLALRLLPPLLYGAGHPYAIPFTGSGDEASISALRREDLLAWQRATLRPEGMQLVVVGDSQLDQILPQLERAFGRWRGEAVEAAPAIPPATAATTPRLYLIDRPNAPQSLLLGGRLLPPTGSADETAIDAAVNVLGGMFSSRLNMNLREDKHWAYGAYAFASNGRGPRPLMLYAQVQTPESAQALAEMARELSEIGSSRPPAEAELQRIVDNEIRGLPGSFETAGAVASAIQGMLRYDRPLDYVSQTTQRLQSLPLTEVSAAAQQYLRQDDFIWLVVGDRREIEASLRELGWGELVLLGEDGQSLPASSD